MSKDRDRLPDKNEEQGPLTTMASLAPLLSLVLQLLELLLKLFGVIK
jgi:hypothetical protein